MNLTKGKYAVLVVAHNGDGNATLSNPEKVTFKNNKITDTFYYYKVIDVEEDSNFDMTMKRVVAKFRLVVKDPTPRGCEDYEVLLHRRKLHLQRSYWIRMRQLQTD